MPSPHHGSVQVDSRPFLEGGGEMGARLREFPWHTHALGEPERWPVALRVGLRILLTTRHPVFIFWGPDYYCFYNDAYARSIGPEKHATMLGGKAIEHWGEIWDLIGPQLKFVSGGYGATWHENQLVPIIRHGRTDEVYWTYSYSPLEDPTAPEGIGGVLVLCSETTEQVLAERRHAFLVRLDDTLRARSDAADMVTAGIDLLGRYLRCSRVGFGLVQDDDRTVVLDTTYARGVAPLQGAYPLEDFGAHNIELQRNGITVVRNDVTVDPGHNVSAFAAIQTRAFVSVPLVRNGRFSAALFVTESSPRNWSRHEVALIEAVAARIFDSVERARSENELRLTTRRFNMALERSAVVLFSQDLDLRYTWIHNPALGFRQEQVVGRRDIDLFPEPKDAALLEDLKREVIRTGRSCRREVPLHDRVGAPIHYDLQIDPLRDDAGRIQGVLCSAVDITQRKQLEAELRESDARKDVFLAVLSHELRSPLAPIQTAAELLASPTLDADQARWAQQVIRRQSLRLGRLLDDLLNVSRITQGKMTLTKQRVSLASVVESAVETVRPLLDRKQHRLSVVLPPDPLMLEVDPLRLSQVLGNLLANAAKYTDNGGEVELRAQSDGALLNVCVRDNGIGLDPESLTNIFSLFSQVDTAAARSEGGLGVGLTLCRGLVELHGGTVKAHSEGYGKGSTFTVQLPLPPDGARAAEPDDGGRAAAASGCRVLVADDNADAADAVAMALKFEGHDVRVARGGGEALSLAESFRPEVAFVDIGMPDLNGHGVAKRVREQAWGADIYLVALTGWGQEEDRRRALEAGFDWHLTKPVDCAALTAVIQSRNQLRSPMPYHPGPVPRSAQDEAP